MVKNKCKINWKHIDIDPNLNSEGLIGVEECTNYSTLNFTNKATKELKHNHSKKLTKKKRKLSPGEARTLITPSTSGHSGDVFIEDCNNDSNIEDPTVWSNFGLPDLLIKALTALGFTEPTLIQSLTLPAAILGCRDIVGVAETGSGKTLGFGLPILSGILKEKAKIPELTNSRKSLYGLILTPTRELAVQIKNHLTAVAKFTDVSIAIVVGGMAAVKQERILKMGPEIVVATPGRLWELIQQGNSHLSQISDIRFLAIDETDRMLEKGHFEELHNILDRINNDKTAMKKRQNFIFSATLTLVHDLPKYLLKKSKKYKMSPQHKLQNIIDALGITNAKIVDITKGSGMPETLTEYRISCPIEEKDYYVYYFLQKYPSRTLIFCNSIGCVRRVSNLLNILGCRALPLHSLMKQTQRLRNLEKFTKDERGILVATDVAARGLDIPKIKHVLHYQTPRTSESYLHRSGRTARATQLGITVLLIDPSEIQSYVRMCKTLNKSQDLPMFPVQEDCLKSVKHIVNLGRQLDKLELDMRKENSEEGWLRKAAKEMDIIVDDFSKKYDSSTISSRKKFADVKRKELTSLLARPIFPAGFTGNYPQFSSLVTSKIP
ncbi:ATP-dependent RNA helicase DDX24 isoform X2 [Tenebrio molitor]|uniref:ATP-dependent RNA helicase DDX24 isoform X2 n=1 Tax=Tenebrio molitor TaxID=7067 RepID=UPI003624A753